MALQVIQGGGQRRPLSEEDLAWSEYLSYLAEQETNDKMSRILRLLSDHILGRPRLKVVPGGVLGAGELKMSRRET